MAHTKQQGATTQKSNRRGKHLGPKVGDGQAVSAGMILVRQRGRKTLAGDNVGMGRDHTLFAKISGNVKYKNATKLKKSVSIIPVQ